MSDVLKDFLGQLIIAIFCGGTFVWHAKTEFWSIRGMDFYKRDDPIPYYLIQGLFALLAAFALSAAIFTLLGIVPPNKN